MILSHREIRLLAQHVVAVNARGWEAEWEDWPNLDEAQVDLLNDAIVEVGNHLAEIVSWDERTHGVDVRDLFERATRP